MWVFLFYYIYKVGFFFCMYFFVRYLGIEVDICDFNDKNKNIILVIKKIYFLGFVL